MTLFLYLVTDHDFMVNTSLNMYKNVVRVIWQQPSVLTNTVLLVVGRAPIGSIPTYKDNAHYIFPNYGRLYHSLVPRPSGVGLGRLCSNFTSFSFLFFLTSFPYFAFHSTYFLFNAPIFLKYMLIVTLKNTGRPGYKAMVTWHQ